MCWKRKEVLELILGGSNMPSVGTEKIQNVVQCELKNVFSK